MHYEVTQFASVVLYQEAPGKFVLQELPKRCQWAPVNGIVIHDVNGDGRLDLILAGNLYQSEIETGRADAGTGVIVLNEGERKWRTLEVYESGLYLANDLKSLQKISLGVEKRFGLVAGNNKGPLQLVVFDQPPVQ